jgi:hypothetical protein
VLTARFKLQRHGADPIVTHVKLDVGAQPHLVEEHNGSTQDFEVTVTIKNVGDRPGARSLTKLTLEWGPLHHTLDAVVYPVGPLKPGKTHTITLGTRDINVRLGLLVSTSPRITTFTSLKCTTRTTGTSAV